MLKDQRNPDKSWDNYYGTESIFKPPQAVANFLRSYLKRNPNTEPSEVRTLDYGCGSGRNFIYLWQQGFTNINGFDYSHGGVKKTRQNLQDILQLSREEAEKRIKQGDMREKLEYYSDEEFGLIICHRVLHEVTYDGTVKAFSQLSRLSAKDAEVFITTTSLSQVQYGNLIEPPQYQTQNNRVIITRGPTLELSIRAGLFRWHFFSEEELKRLIAENGFELVGDMGEYAHQVEEEPFKRVSWNFVLKKK